MLTESESDLRSNEHYLSGSENKAWKKFRQVIVALCLVIGCRNQTLLFMHRFADECIWIKGSDMKRVCSISLQAYSFPFWQKGP